MLEAIASFTTSGQVSAMPTQGKASQRSKGDRSKICTVRQRSANGRLTSYRLTRQTPRRCVDSPFFPHKSAF
ncbi:hypothetical protein [Allocoleopsis sp.]|uniref:hypothetical protein n=1 Tax=Allocoleopsis sp. TaxID=3088169 RepID=UPI002FD5D6D4